MVSKHRQQGRAMAVLAHAGGQQDTPRRGAMLPCGYKPMVKEGPCYVDTEEDLGIHVYDAPYRRKIGCGLFCVTLGLSGLLAASVFCQVTYRSMETAGSSYLDASVAAAEHSARELVLSTSTAPPPPPTLRFPISFEKDPVEGCPVGWTCSGETWVCQEPTPSVNCTHPGIFGVNGSRYLKVGSDKGTGNAASASFYLPPEASKLALLRAGGADVGSGLYLIRAKDGKVICSAEGGPHSNSFFTAWCTIYEATEREVVYLSVQDRQISDWGYGKVLVDNIRLTSANGTDIKQADLVLTGVSPATA